MLDINKIYCGDAIQELQKLHDCCIDCVITSPPYYGLRDYGIDNQIGLESNPDEYVFKLRNVFSEVKRVLKNEGTLWLIVGDSYASSGGPQQVQSINSHRIGGSDTQNAGKSRSPPMGMKPKNLIGIPWMLAFSLRQDGYYLRSDIIWSKPNCIPESVKDRPTKSHEYIFLLTKSDRYYYDNDSIKEMVNNDGYVQKRNRRSVWSINTVPYKGAHFATFPESLVELCCKAGCPEGGLILDPFMGSGTTGVVSKKLCRNYIGIDLNPDYCNLARKRINNIPHALSKFITE